MQARVSVIPVRFAPSAEVHHPSRIDARKMLRWLWTPEFNRGYFFVFVVIPPLLTFCKASPRRIGFVGTGIASKSVPFFGGFSFCIPPRLLKTGDNLLGRPRGWGARKLWKPRPGVRDGWPVRHYARHRWMRRPVEAGTLAGRTDGSRRSRQPPVDNAKAPGFNTSLDHRRFRASSRVACGQFPSPRLSTVRGGTDGTVRRCPGRRPGRPPGR